MKNIHHTNIPNQIFELLHRHKYYKVVDRLFFEEIRRFDPQRLCLTEIIIRKTVEDICEGLMMFDSFDRYYLT